MSLVQSIVGKWLGPDVARNASSAPRRAIPEPGDVVRMALPTEDNPNRPGTHFRHGIVISAKTAQNGVLTLQVVPAEQLQRSNTDASTFHLADAKAAHAAGLPAPATFDLKKAVIVEWSQKFASTTERPLVGALATPDYTRFLQAYGAWRKDQQVAANKARIEKEKPTYVQQVATTPEVRQTLRDRGKVREVWA